MRTDNMTPPHNPEAEQSVLGACLISSEALDTVTELLRPGDLHRHNGASPQRQTFRPRNRKR